MATAPIAVANRRRVIVPRTLFFGKRRMRMACLSREGGDPGLRTPQDQGMDVVSALIGVDCLEVHHVADHVVLVGDAVAAMHVAGSAGDVERLATIVAL